MAKVVAGYVTSFRLALVVGLLVLVASGPVAAQDLSLPTYRYQRGEASVLSSTGGRALRQGNVLRLLARDRVVVFENIEYCEGREKVCRARRVRDCQHDISECRVFSLVRYDRKARAFIVYVSQYEASQVLWIDDRTGTATNILSIPEMSPDGKRFAVARTVHCCSDGYSGIQILQVGTLGLEFQHDSNIEEDWADFGNIRWLNNDAVSVATQFPYSGRERGHTIVERRSDGWALRWAPELGKVR